MSFSIRRAFETASKLTPRLRNQFTKAETKYILWRKFVAQEEYDEHKAREHGESEEDRWRLWDVRNTVSIDRLEAPDDEKPIDHEIDECEASLHKKQVYCNNVRRECIYEWHHTPLSNKYIGSKAR